MLFTHICTGDVQAATLATTQVLEDLVQTGELRLEHFEVCVVF